MAETIVINAATREIVVPDAERNFGVAGERNVERKHIRIEGRIVEGTDLATGFAWKVSCENGAHNPCADLIDSIVADAEGIEFDWIVGAGPMAYKGDLKFSVCAKRVNALAEVLNEWHSQIGVGYVSAGLEATPEEIGGYDLAAQLQQLAAESKVNAESAANSAAAAKESQTAAANSATDAANSAAAAKNSQDAAAESAEQAKANAEQAKANAEAAGEAAKKVIDEGIADKLAEMQNIQTDVKADKTHIDTAAATATKARDDAQSAQKAAADSAAEAAASQQTVTELVKQAKEAATEAQGYAGAATFSIGYDADGMLSLFMEA